MSSKGMEGPVHHGFGYAPLWVVRCFSFARTIQYNAP